VRKGYVVSLADLRDLRVELDINQNDFAKLKPRHRGVISVDAFPTAATKARSTRSRPKRTARSDRAGEGEMLKPDEYLRPEMNASVAFLATRRARRRCAQKAVVFVPAAAVRKDAVFVSSTARRCGDREDQRNDQPGNPG